MANLATHLRLQFSEHCPHGWHTDHEVRFLSEQVGRLLGYAPQVDVLLERDDGSLRLWIEFELIRVDPVANHARFATAHLFKPQAGGDVFLSMISPHVAAHHRSVAANMILAMRRLGMTAFQTLLLPYHTRAGLRRLRSLSLDALRREPFDIPGEITRVLSVALPALESPAGNIHFAANIIEVLFNVYRWNLQLQTDAGRACWGQRAVTCFVYDPRFRHFAPARFAAYVPVAAPVDPAAGFPTGMTVEQYAPIARTRPIADSRRARRHLAGNLAMRLVTPDTVPGLSRHFDQWLTTCRDAVDLPGTAPQILLPPAWLL